jgi:hypothetical protein
MLVIYVLTLLQGCRLVHAPLGHSDDQLTNTRSGTQEDTRHQRVPCQLRLSLEFATLLQSRVVFREMSKCLQHAEPKTASQAVAHRQIRRIRILVFMHFVP